VGVRVGEGDGVWEGVNEGAAVAEAVGVRVGVTEAVRVGVNVTVGAGVSVGTGVGVSVELSPHAEASIATIIRIRIDNPLDLRLLEYMAPILNHLSAFCFATHP